MWSLVFAACASPWTVEPYVYPQVDGQVVRVGSTSVLQAFLGAEGGLRYRREPRGDGPALLGRSRLRGGVLQAVGIASTGFDVRVGSFIGPGNRRVLYQAGPDVWVNRYGLPGAPDYHLPTSVGIDVVNQLFVKVDPSVRLQFGLTPGWAFARARQVGRWGPFHELTAMAAVQARLGPMVVVVGYRRWINAAGTFDGLILSGGL